ncbi:hypothetical protein MPH_10039 [Macrophomina phaseolina MS6]|uniref:mRNA N(6)-methyladenine demethylase n=1 Tax=Macrophomina phaseolina (strain MS6) TaxID=1126212 RepID=K2QSC4_MACPH|nr:hypothetical protein MPH_10039 [Macrophomina phaseolina MS6]
MSLDPHQRPPDPIRNAYKKYQKLRGAALDDDPELLDLRGRNSVDGLRVVRSLSSADLRAAFRAFLADGSTTSSALPEEPVPVYEHRCMPGLHIVPSLFPAPVQKSLLSRLIHRDLSNPAHRTNVHLHYHVPYPLESSSFFSHVPAPDPLFIPKDPTVHRPLSITQFLNKKLRWVTLGGQYDWTQKVYPSTPPPPFPADVGALLHGVFPDMEPQAAIVNFYSPGDTLSMHRDVSEGCDRGLVSISIGCDGIFVIGRKEPRIGSSADDLEKDSDILTIRLRSGDAVYMSGPSRFAWHGVPQIVPDTCPEWLENWPAPSTDGLEGGDHEGVYEEWKGWMRAKRINLNVRQMWE